jgi:hypothetical protein
LRCSSCACALQQSTAEYCQLTAVVNYFFAHETRLPAKHVQHCHSSTSYSHSSTVL